MKGWSKPACFHSSNHTLVTTCARQIPRLSDGTGTDKAEGKMTLSGYATEQTTKRSPKDPWTTARTPDTASPDLDMSQAHYHITKPFEISLDYTQLIYDPISSPCLEKVLKKIAGLHLNRDRSSCILLSLSCKLISLPPLFIGLIPRICSLRALSLNGSLNLDHLLHSLEWHLGCQIQGSRPLSNSLLFPATLRMVKKSTTNARMKWGGPSWNNHTYSICPNDTYNEVSSSLQCTIVR